MKTDRQKHSKESWPKVVARKWLNIRGRNDEFYSDHTLHGRVGNKTERRKSCSDQDRCVYAPQDFPGWLKESTTGLKKPKYESNHNGATDSVDYRMFVGTWNVGGKPPHAGLNLRDWLTAPTPSDIYVLGFQEIVPLNAGNVLGAEDNGPASKWLNLIRQALNTTANNKNDDAKTNQHNPTNCPASQADHHHHQTTIKPRLSFSDLLSLEDELNSEDFERFLTSGDEDFPSPPTVSRRYSNGPTGTRRYCLVASKQMVGLFLCVWVDAGIYKHISDLKASRVGRGIMGYLGNKGSVSISMRLHDTSFCFVCTHLTSGEKEGDELRRNSDVMEILRRTRFSHSFKGLGQSSLPPTSILEHDKVIWLGDLNYRLAFGSGDTHELLEKSDWQALLEKDQLRIEQKAGRVFKGWEEGRICFAPTYKYLTDSDHYVAAQTTTKSKEKPRIPAWCDRILWKGEGLKQMRYERGESKFSDHRPVHSLFSVPIDVKNTTTTTLLPPLAAASGSTCNARVQAEELLSRACLETVSEVQ